VQDGDAFHLDPALHSAGAIGRVNAFCDKPLHAQVASVLEQPRGRLPEVDRLAHQDPPARRSDEELCKHAAAVSQGRSQFVPVKVQKVEGVIEQPVLPARHRGAQGEGVWHAVLAGHNDLAVEHGCSGLILGCCSDERRTLRSIRSLPLRENIFAAPFRR